MQHTPQPSIKNLITTTTQGQDSDFIQQNKSQKGSIIDLLRKQSDNSTYDIGDLDKGRIKATPQLARSLKSMEESKDEEDYFAQNAQSQLIIEDVLMKKIQSQRVTGNDFFGQTVQDTIEEID